MYLYPLDDEFILDLKSFIKTLDPKEEKEGSTISGSRFDWTGLKHTKETRKKMSLAQKGKIISEEQKKKLSIANKGQIFSEEHRKKLSIAKMGKNRKPFSEEHRKNLSIAQRRISKTNAKKS